MRFRVVTVVILVLVNLLCWAWVRRLERVRRNGARKR